MRFFLIINILFSLVCLSYALWLQIPSPTTNDINDIELRSPTYGWMIGYDNSARFNGGGWTSFPLSSPYNVQGVSAVSNNSAWAVAPNGIVLNFTGTQWQHVATPTPQNLNDIYLTSSLNGWAVGDHILLHFEGITWNVAMNPPCNLLCIFGNSNGDLWVGGSNGMIYGYNGSSWMPHQSPTNATITGIWFTDSTHGWACSDAGEILSWSGTQWSIVPQPNTTPLNGICVPASNLGYAVGNNGRIVEYYNSNWTINSSPTTQNLNSVFMPSTTTGFIGGDNGVLLQFYFTPVEPISVGNIKAFYH